MVGLFSVRGDNKRGHLGEFLTSQVGDRPSFVQNG